MPLFVLATPIGNLGDISARALETLRAAEVVLAEDTRHSRQLLDHFGISRPLRSFHDHSHAVEVDKCMAELEAGLRVVLVSDAGTPAISDPGYELVRAARLRNLPVIPIPGASAVVSFLCASGLPTDRFQFVGFAPRGQGERLEAIDDWGHFPGTTVMYESPERVVATVSGLASRWPDRRVAVGREITKKFEEFIFGSASEVSELLQKHDNIRGEFVVGIEGAPKRMNAGGLSDAQERELTLWIGDLVDAGMPTKAAAKILARRFPLAEKQIYERCVARKNVEG